MVNDPKQPPPLPDEDSVHPEKSPTPAHGVPPDASVDRPTGLPTDDRHQTETVPDKA